MKELGHVLKCILRILRDLIDNRIWNEKRKKDGTQFSFHPLRRNLKLLVGTMNY